jgi:hypothetical protein
MATGWQLEHFAPLVGSTFTVALADGGTLALTLHSASRVEARMRQAGGREPFDLRFHSYGAAYLSQCTCLMTHDVLGTLEIFIVPIGRLPDGSGFIHQAIFN